MLINENKRQAKDYLKAGKISREDFDTLYKIFDDEKVANKYIGWLCKIWINEKPDFDMLRNTITELHAILSKGSTEVNDINAFKTIEDARAHIRKENESFNLINVKELQNDYEVIYDNEDLFMAVPHTHQASRYLGFKYFSDTRVDNDSDCAIWCITYKNSKHFNDYYFGEGITFYMTWFKSERMFNKLKEIFGNNWEDYIKCVIMDIEVDDRHAISSIKNKEVYSPGRTIHDEIEVSDNVKKLIKFIDDLEL